MRERYIKTLKAVLFLLCLLPFALLVFRFFRHELGADPINRVTLFTGRWTLRFLLITLAVTPARKLLKQPWLIRFRKMFGLYAFFYACLHLMTYIWLDKFFDFSEMFEDVLKRRFITAGATAFTLMVPLALTSTNWAVRKMGGKNWRRLHRLIYFSAIAGVIHFWWKLKPGVPDWKPYAYLLAALLLYRIIVHIPDLPVMKRSGAPIKAPQKAS